MIITVTCNPAIDKTATVDQLVVGGLNRLSNIVQDAGGKGVNVSKTIKALHGESVATGFIAGNSGEFIRKSLENAGIETDFIQVTGETRTNLKVLNSEMELTELNEPGPVVSEDKIAELIERIRKKADLNTWLVLSGNVGPKVGKDLYKRMIEELKDQNIRCILDADGPLFKEGVQAKPAVIKPNRHELAEYFGVDEDMSNEKVIELASSFLNDETTLVVVSMGLDGSIFLTKDQTLIYPALKIDYRSAVGAGDAMVAAIAYGLDKNLPLEEVASLAVATSAGACMSEGTSPADYETVMELKARVTTK